MQKRTRKQILDKLLSEKEAIIDSVDDTNIVRIRIWEWDNNPGHISMDTHHVYVSFWPDLEDTSKNKRKYGQRKGVFVSYDDDKKREGKPADYTYDLKLPLFDMMHLFLIEKMEAFEASSIKWNLIATGGFNRKGRQYNCATFIYKCLVNGGIGTVIDSFQEPPIKNGKFLLLSLLLIGLGTAGAIFSNYKIGNELLIPSLIVVGLALALCCICFCYGCCYNLQPLEIALRLRSLESPSSVKKLLIRAGAIERDSKVGLLSNGEINNRGYQIINSSLLLNDLSRFKNLFELHYGITFPDPPQGYSDIDAALFQLEEQLIYLNKKYGNLFKFMIEPYYEANEDKVYAAVNKIKDNENELSFFNSLVKESLLQHLFDKYPFSKEIIENIMAKDDSETTMVNNVFKLLFLLTLHYLLINKVNHLKYQLSQKTFTNSEKWNNLNTPLSEQINSILSRHATEDDVLVDSSSESEDKGKEKILEI